MDAYSFDFCDFDDCMDLGARPKTDKRAGLPSSTSSNIENMSYFFANPFFIFTFLGVIHLLLTLKSTGDFLGQ